MLKDITKVLFTHMSLTTQRVVKIHKTYIMESDYIPFFLRLVKKTIFVQNK